MFNPISSATTVRNFWGKYWHQIVRRGVSTWSTALVDFLGIPHGTNASSYTQLWFGFLLSGYFHSTSHLILPSPTNITMPERTYGIFAFFVIQVAVVQETWIWRGRKHVEEGIGLHLGSGAAVVERAISSHRIFEDAGGK
jgi:hypothetical protein